MHYLPFIFLSLKNSKKKNPKHQTSTLNSQCSCSAVVNEHPSQMYFDTSFNLYIPPKPRKSYINFSYAIPSKADREALMIRVPLGAAVPA